MEKGKKKNVVLQGIPASPGKISGKVRLVKSFKKIPKINADEIIVASFLPPDFISLVNKEGSFGIITDRGGATSHIAVLAREFNIPYVAGVGVATKVLRENARIVLDGHDGTVYEIG